MANSANKNSNDDLFDDDDLDLGEDGQRAGRISDGLRKLLVSGMSAVFMTEEGIRGALGDMRLPKDALGYLVQQTERTRKEVLRAVGGELHSFLRGLDMAGELRRALNGMHIKVNAEIVLTDKNGVEQKVNVNTANAAKGRPAKSTRKTKSKKGKKS